MLLRDAHWILISRNDVNRKNYIRPLTSSLLPDNFCSLHALVPNTIIRFGYMFANKNSGSIHSQVSVLIANAAPPGKKKKRSRAHRSHQNLTGKTPGVEGPGPSAGADALAAAADRWRGRPPGAAPPPRLSLAGITAASQRHSGPSSDVFNRWMSVVVVVRRRGLLLGGARCHDQVAGRPGGRRGQVVDEARNPHQEQEEQKHDVEHEQRQPHVLRPAVRPSLPPPTPPSGQCAQVGAAGVARARPRFASPERRPEGIKISRSLLSRVLSCRPRVPIADWLRRCVVGLRGGRRPEAATRLNYACNRQRASPHATLLEKLVRGHWLLKGL